MEAYQLKNVNFTYPNTGEQALKQINMHVDKGDFLLIGGTTGSGKTTLLRLLKPQTQPVGKLLGSIFFNGTMLEEVREKSSAEEIGMIFQNPDNQIVMQTVWQQLCHGMENLNYPPSLMQKRMAEIVPFFGMEAWLHQRVETLSGGQKQLLNLAAVMMLQPKVLLLDEPTAQLDPISASAFIDLLARINQELSVTVIMCEHRLDSLYPIANKLVLMKEGGILYQGSTGEVAQQVWNKQDQHFMLYLSAISRLYLKIEKEAAPAAGIPMTVKAGKRWFDRLYQSHSNSFRDRKSLTEQQSYKKEELLIECRDVYFQYEKKSSPVLRQATLQLFPRELFVLLGGNGAGKSTLLKLIAGVHNHQRGHIRFNGREKTSSMLIGDPERIGYVAQNPMPYFTRDTVWEQLQAQAEVLSLKDEERIRELAYRFGLKAVLGKHPFDISGGQQQQLVLALVLMADPHLLLMDEPTKGLDPAAKNVLAQWLKQLQHEGKAILMVSHDIEFAANNASRCGILFDGNVIAVDDPVNFFTKNYYYTTLIHRVVRECLAEEITEEGVMARWNPITSR